MVHESAFSIAPVRTAADVERARALFVAYAASLSVDLAYQDFGDELATLPGRYVPPHGELLLARRVGDDESLGCVALRTFAPGIGEMKRLYVAPAARGMGLGRALVEAICAAARGLSMREIRLDTLGSMTSAIALYETLGFARIAPYYATPVEGTIFFSRAP